MTDTVLREEEDTFTLELTRPIAMPTPAQATKPILPLAQAERSEVDARIAARVDDFLVRLRDADLQSDAFREMRDRAFAAGRREIADVSDFINNNPILKQTTFQEYQGTQEAKVIQEMATLLAKANPKGRDLLGPVKVLGVPMPFGNKLRAYFDEFKTVDNRLKELATVLEEEEDAMRREIATYDVVEGQLVDKVRQLDQATSYLALLDRKLESEAQSLQATLPDKAKALREEVLYYVRSNLGDAAQLKVLAAAGVGQIGQLRHTGRMTLRGTSRIKEMGLTALTIAQTISVAVYKQKERMALNMKVQAMVNEVVSSVGDAILDHTQMVIEFEKNPLFAIDVLAAGIDKTLSAIHLLNDFRSAAVDTMKADNQKLDALYDKVSTGMRLDDKLKPGNYGDVLSL